MRRFAQVDVFGTRAGTGNPLAVVLDADGLTTDEMAAFARWTMLSETTFLLPPTDSTADYRVRIFTTTEELPFAGHPTLGSAHAWLAGGGVPRDPERLVQECGAGLVEVRRDADTLSFKAPPITQGGPLDDRTLDRALTCLRIGREAVVAHAWGVNGPRWAMIQLADVEAVRALRPDSSALDDFLLGVVGLCPAEAQHAYEVRAFCPPPPSEDPVTGSLNAAVADWLQGRGLAPASYVVRQGMQAGSDGTVHVRRAPDGLWIGGAVADVITGQVAWPAG